MVLLYPMVLNGSFGSSDPNGSTGSPGSNGSSHLNSFTGSSGSNDSTSSIGFNGSNAEEGRHMHMHTTYFLNISCEFIGYSTKLALLKLNGVD